MSEEIENGNPDLSPIENVQSSMFLFKLNEDFVESYRSKSSPFGYKDAAGNSVGEITFLRTYSRLKENGTKETWPDVCERVINGMYSLQKEHCKKIVYPGTMLGHRLALKKLLTGCLILNGHHQAVAFGLWEQILLMFKKILRPYKTVHLFQLVK